jgi:hypothetical protein
MKTAAQRNELETQRSWLLQVFSQAQLRGYYGRLTVCMENGKLTRIVKEESLKMPTSVDSK